MIFGLLGENARQCWSGWMLFVPCVTMFVHFHVRPMRSPRHPSIAPRNTCAVLFGVAATYQSYHAWLVSRDAGVVIFFQTLPDRRQRYADEPIAPKTYATSGEVATRSTVSRAQAPAGGVGSATALNDVPPLVEL